MKERNEFRNEGEGKQFQRDQRAVRVCSGGGRGNLCLRATRGALDWGMARASQATTSGLPVQAEGRTHSECTEEPLKRF